MRHELVLVALVLTVGGCPSPQTPHEVPTPPGSAPAPAQVGTETSQADEAAGSAAQSGPLVLDGTPEIPDGMRARLNQYLNTRRAGLGDISFDGKSVLVTTRFAETGQIHLIEQPGGARKQLTFSPEPVSSPTFVPGSTRSLIYSADVGGNEQHQLYRLELASGRATQLTDARARNQQAVWSHDGKSLAFMSNARNLRDFDVWVGDGTTAGSNRMVVEGKGYYFPIDFSHDGKRLLVGEYLSINHSRLYLADVATGKLDELSSPSSKASYGAALFSVDGKSVYVTTDREGEFRELYQVSLAKKTWRSLSRRVPWDIDGIALTRDGKTLAFAANKNGASQLHLLDTRSGKTSVVPNTPWGVISGLTFASGKDVLAMSMTGPKLAGDVYTYDVRRKRLTQWTESEIGGLNAEDFVEPVPIEVTSFDGRKIPAWYYRPTGKGPFPVIINIHGGPEGQSRPYFSSFTQFMLKESRIAMVYPNVRGSAGYGKTYLTLDNGFKREDSVKDIGAILDWIGEQRELDADNVGVLGGSYGGYMVLASLTHFADRIKAGVDVVGISNFVTFLENTADYRRDLRRVEYGDERDPAMRAHLEKISPLNHVDRIKSALFVAQGANDPRVPASEAEQIVKAVRSAGHDVWYMLAKDEGHGFKKKSNRDTYILLTALFFEKHLQGK